MMKTCGITGWPRSSSVVEIRLIEQTWFKPRCVFQRNTVQTGPTWHWGSRSSMSKQLCHGSFCSSTQPFSQALCTSLQLHRLALHSATQIRGTRCRASHLEPFKRHESMNGATKTDWKLAARQQPDRSQLGVAPRLAQREKVTLDMWWGESWLLA